MLNLQLATIDFIGFLATSPGPPAPGANLELDSGKFEIWATQPGDRVDPKALGDELNSRNRADRRPRPVFVSPFFQFA